MHIQSYPPIHGSEMNPTARLFKQFTPVEGFSLDENAISIQQNYYATYFNFRFADASEKDLNDEQKAGGDESDSVDYTIKMYGRWFSKEKSIDEPELHDVIEFAGMWWQVEKIRRKRQTMMIDMATLFIALKRIEKSKVTGGKVSE